MTPSTNILLTTYENPFYEDYLLPSGRLREHRSGASRADIVLVTKCPTFMAESDQVRMKYQISLYTHATVYFLTIDYLEPQPIFDNGLQLNNRVVAISGMANPKPFEKEVSSRFNMKFAHHYRDHYRYKQQDIKDIIMELNSDTSLITTEKDMVKLKSFSELSEYSCYYIPIRMKFLRDESLFQSQIDSMLKNYVQ